MSYSHINGSVVVFMFFDKTVERLEITQEQKWLFLGMAVDQKDLT